MKRIGGFSGTVRQFGTSLLAYDGGYPATGTPLPKPSGDSEVIQAQKVLQVPLFTEVYPDLNKNNSKPSPPGVWDFGPK